MKRLALLLGVAAFAIVVPAEAKNASHPSHPSHGSKANAHSCAPRNKGYYAAGSLTSATLTPSAKKGHYDGSITADLTRANHGAPTGSQTFMLTNARVRFGKDVSSTAPAPGSRVHLHGKITVLPRHCSTTGFTPTITIHNVEIKKAK